MSNSKAEEAFKNSLSKRNAKEKFSDGLDTLEKRLGIKLEPSASATETCFLEVYKQTDNYEIPDVNMGKDFKYYRPIDVEEYMLLH